MLCARRGKDLHEVWLLIKERGREGKARQQARQQDGAPRMMRRETVTGGQTGPARLDLQIRKEPLSRGRDTAQKPTLVGQLATSSPQRSSQRAFMA